MNGTRAACKRFAEKAPPACCGEARTHSRRKPKAESTARSNPASGRVHGPGSTAKTGAKKRPPENASIARFQGLCCYRIRSEIKAVSGARVRQCERARRGRLRTGHGPLASGLPEKRRQPAAARPEPICAASQKPRPAQPHGRAFAAWPGVFRAFPATGPRLGFCPLKPAQSPPAGACMAPVPLQKQEQKKAPRKTPLSHGFRGFAAIEFVAQRSGAPVDARGLRRSGRALAKQAKA